MTGQRVSAGWQSGSRASRQRIRWHPSWDSTASVQLPPDTVSPPCSKGGGWFSARCHSMAPRNGNSSRHYQCTTHGVLAAANTTGPAGLGSGRLMAKARRRGDLPTVTDKQHTEGTHQVGPCSRTPPLEKADNRRRQRLHLSPAPRTRDCTRVVHMRARWLTYACVPLHGEGDGQHVTWPRESGCCGALAGMAAVGGCPTTMCIGPAARRIRAVGQVDSGQ